MKKCREKEVSWASPLTVSFEIGVSKSFRRKGWQWSSRWMKNFHRTDGKENKSVFAGGRWMCNMRSTRGSVQVSKWYTVKMKLNETRVSWVTVKMVSTNPSLGVVALNRGRNTFRGVPKAEIERRTNTLLQAMTVSGKCGDEWLKIRVERITILSSHRDSFVRSLYS